jgi:hypothetical protein
MRKAHFIEGDMDSLSYAISGDPGKDCDQEFEYVIKDEGLYMENVQKWFVNMQLGRKDKKKLFELSF